MSVQMETDENDDANNHSTKNQEIESGKVSMAFTAEDALSNKENSKSQL